MSDISTVVENPDSIVTAIQNGWTWLDAVRNLQMTIADFHLLPFSADNIASNMIIPKQNRRLIYENLFKEGVLVAKKDFNAPKHEELDVPNLQVIKALQSLTSRGYVKTQFSWQWYYYVLTLEGVEYLRNWLNLPAEIVPATHKKAVRPTRPAAVRPGGGEGTYRAPRGEREGYRRKEEGAPGEYRPQFAGGVGRGGPRD